MCLVLGARTITGCLLRNLARRPITREALRTTFTQRRVLPDQVECVLMHIHAHTHLGLWLYAPGLFCHVHQNLSYGISRIKHVKTQTQTQRASDSYNVEMLVEGQHIPDTPCMHALCNTATVVTTAATETRFVFSRNIHAARVCQHALVAALRGSLTAQPRDPPQLHRLV